MADSFEAYASGLESPATIHFAITPNDGADLANIPRALYVDAAGTLVVRDKAGTDITYNVVAGATLPFRGVRILATGTTATIVGWY